MQRFLGLGQARFGYLGLALPVFLAVGMQIWPFGGGQKITLTSTTAVPAATGTVDVSKDSNGNTKLDIKVEHLAQPSALTPPAVDYVVWIQASGGEPINQGVLQVGSNLNGEYKTSTSYREFDLIISAEQSPHVATPSEQVVLKAHVARKD